MLRVSYDQDLGILEICVGKSPTLHTSAFQVKQVKPPKGFADLSACQDGLTDNGSLDGMESSRRRCW